MKYTLLLTLILLISCSPTSKKDVQGDALLAYSNKESNFVAYANLEALKGAKLLNKEKEELLNHKHADEEWNEFVEMTGLDPKEDIHEVLVSGHFNDETDKSFVFAVKGKFDEAKLVEYVNKKSKEGDTPVEVTKEAYNGVTIYTVDSNDGKHDRGSIAFINNDVVLFSVEDNLKSAIDKKSSLQDNSDMMAKISKVNTNHMYSVANVSDYKRDEIANNPMLQQAELIKHVSMGLSLDEKLTLKIVGECLNSEDAVNIQQAVEGLIAIARMGVAGQRELIDFMNEIDVTNDKNEVFINVEVTQERIDQLKAAKEKFKNLQKI